MDRVRSEEGCEREEIMYKHSPERGVGSAHFGHCFFFWSDPFVLFEF
jgi:hypothetical protein